MAYFSCLYEYDEKKHDETMREEGRQESAEIIASLNSEIENLTSKSENLASKNESLASENENLTSEIKTLRSKLAKYENG